MIVTDIATGKKVVLTIGRVIDYVNKHGDKPIMDKRLHEVVVLRLATYRNVRVTENVYKEIVKWATA